MIRVLFVAVFIAVFAVFAVSCGKTVEVVSTAPPSSTASPVVTSEPTPAPTITPVPATPTPEPVVTPVPTAKPTPTPEPSANPTPSPLNCIVLAPEYCSSAEDYSHSVPGGQEFYVAFRLPVNVPIFSPFDGVIFASFTPSYGAGGFPMEASLIQIRGQDGNNAMNIVGSIEAKVQEGDAVQKGQVIAVTTETLSDSPNGYAIAVRFLKKDTFGGMQESGELFERFFPYVPYTNK